MNPRLSKDQYIPLRHALRVLIKQRAPLGGRDMRHALLALAFVRGRSYRSIESRTHRVPDPERVENILLSVGFPASYFTEPGERFSVRPVYEWVAEPEVPKVQRLRTRYRPAVGWWSRLKTGAELFIRAFGL